MSIKIVLYVVIAYNILIVLYEISIGGYNMEKKKLSILTSCHLVLMVIMALVSLATIILLTFGLNSLPASLAKIAAQKGPALTSYVIVLVLNFFALVTGIIYIRKGYTKAAAKYYRIFIILTVASNLVSAVASVLYQGFDIAFVFKIVKILLLLLLVFGKDLGERNTWIVLVAAIVADLIYDFFFDPVQGGFIHFLVLTVTRILCMSTIGLSIYGKFEDKKARGREV